jgi:multiple sugar transport system ATP-binding protein
MRTEISKLHKRLNTTFVYVTHDQTEALTMGTRIVVMKDGVIQQVDSPQNIYQNPNNMFVAGFIGSPQMNFIDCKIEKHGDAVYAVFGNAKIPVPADKVKTIIDNGYIGKDVVCGIRPEHIDDSPEFIKEHENCVIEGKVDLIEHMGAETYLYAVIENKNVVARVEPTSKAQLDQTIMLGIDISKMHLFDKETENTIF